MDLPGSLAHHYSAFGAYLRGRHSSTTALLIFIGDSLGPSGVVCEVGRSKIDVHVPEQEDCRCSTKPMRQLSSPLGCLRL